MGLWVPPVSWDYYQSNITTPTTGTSVTAGGTTHTKNTTYTTLIASTSQDAQLIEIRFSDVAQTAATDQSMLVDIAIGAAASETVIIPNLNAGGAFVSGPSGGYGQTYLFPLYIPAGSRISATAQATIVSDTVLVTVKLWGQPSSPVWSGSEVIDYGTTLATSTGTAVAVGLSGAEGAFTQITASTTRGHSYIAAGVGLNADTTVLTGINFLDVGVGPATEDPILEDCVFGTTTAEDMRYWGSMGVYCQIPAATRLTSRISSSQGGAQSYDVILYGVS